MWEGTFNCTVISAKLFSSLLSLQHHNGHGCYSVHVLGYANTLARSAKNLSATRVVDVDILREKTDRTPLCRRGDFFAIKSSTFDNERQNLIAKNKKFQFDIITYLGHDETTRSVLATRRSAAVAAELWASVSRRFDYMLAAAFLATITVPTLYMFAKNYERMQDGYGGVVPSCVSQA